MTIHCHLCGTPLDPKDIQELHELYGSYVTAPYYCAECSNPERDNDPWNLASEDGSIGGQQ